MEIFVIFILIVLNGVFAMSEIALVSARKARLAADAKKGDSNAKEALKLANNPSRFLSTVQIGITLIGILTGIYSGEKITDDFTAYLNQYDWAKPYSEGIAVAAVVVILTYFSLVLGEIVPKRIGLTHPVAIAKVMARPMQWLSILTAPFTWLLSLTTDLIIKIFNIKKNKESLITEEEIKAILQEGADAGAIDEIEQDLVENVFHLGDRKVKSLMTSRVDIVWLDIEDSYETNVQKMVEYGYSAYPVCRGSLDKLAGILYSKDVLKLKLGGINFSLTEHIKPAYYLPETTRAYKALEIFKESNTTVSIVVDEYGGVQGVFTLFDLVDALFHDVTEEHPEEQEIFERADGSFLVDASMSLQEFGRFFEMDIDADHEVNGINTLGGLVFHFARKIPKIGETFSWRNFSFEIVDMDKRRIDKVLVRKEKQSQK